MNTEFPTLDTLSRYGMRSAYVLLMLCARSGTDFERLHGLVPKQCQVPRNVLIALKKERTRILRGSLQPRSEYLTRDRHSPSDTFILREFEEVRNKQAGLRGYYSDLLSAHSNRVELASETANKSNLFSVRFPESCTLSWERDYLRCELKQLRVTIGIKMIQCINLICLCPTHKLEAEASYLPICVHWCLELSIGVTEDILDCERVLTFLKLPRFDHACANRFGRRTLYYQFDYSDHAEALLLPYPKEESLGMKLIRIDEAKLQEILAFLTKQGIELTPQTPEQ